MNRKAEQVVEEVGDEGMFNHGVSWLRGPLIGKGAFGSVYLAHLKNPKSRNGYYPSVMAVKSAEVSVSSSLQKEKEVFNHLNGCPYILKCFGEETTTNKDGEMVYNVLLEYASGGTLAALIKKSNGVGLPELDVRRYTRDILEGIDYIHSHGYVHCDLKPENILLASTKKDGTGCDFVAKIGDFGVAKKAERSKKRKVDGSIRGTALYMAPESVVDHVQEPPSDIWALGCIVFEMLTGNPAWDLKPNITAEELMRKIGDRFELPKIPADISKDGRDFLKGCLVRKPMFRLTAEMLLDHPFVTSLGEEQGRELVDILDYVELDSTIALCDDHDDGEFSASSFSQDWSFTSEEGSSVSSWLHNAEESNHATSSTIITRDVHSLKPLAHVSPSTLQQYQPICTIPAGA